MAKKDDAAGQTGANEQNEAALKAAEEAKAKADAEAAAAKAKTDAEKAKLITVTVRHKTEYQNYRRAGLVLTKTAATHEVTAEQLAALKSDKLVEVSEK
jgi:hypothetical protein